MVVMDSTTLILLFHPSARAPSDPATGKPVEKCQERIEFLIETLSKARIRVIVPTPVLSEILVKAGTDKARILNELTNSTAFKIQPFDAMAAVEVAELTDSDLQSGKPLSATHTRAKIKYDRQIVAIAKVIGAQTIYTDDAALARRAAANGLTAISVSDLQLRPLPPQAELFAEAVSKGQETRTTPAEAVVQMVASAAPSPDK